jgi:hypothetical protein
MSKGVTCERCEAVYHLNCLDPPLKVPPRAEWICPGCIEEKGPAFVHPNKTARVMHPSTRKEGIWSLNRVHDVNHNYTCI